MLGMFSSNASCVTVPRLAPSTEPSQRTCFTASTMSVNTPFSSSAPDGPPTHGPSLEKQIHDARMSLTVEPSIVAVTPNVYLGNFASSVSAAVILKHCITSIIAIASTPPSAYTGSLQNQRSSSLPQVTYHYVQCRDSNSSNLLKHLPQLYEDIERLTKLGPVLVHCSQGMSRSPAAVVGYLMKKEARGMNAVLAELKNKRDVRIREGFMDQLRVWEECECELYEEGPWTGRRAKKPYRELLDRLEGRSSQGEGQNENKNDPKERRDSV